MDVTFTSNKLKKELTNSKLVAVTYGNQAILITLRPTQLAAAANLAELRKLPQIRCHELVGDRKGQLALDLKHPSRLIIEPNHYPTPRKPDSGLDWFQVTAITIIEIEKDYH